MNSQQITCVVYFPIKPGSKAQFSKHIFDMLDLMALESDFLCASLYEDVNEPETMVLLESWKCLGNEFLQEESQSYRTSFESILPSLLSGPKRTKFLHEVRAYRGLSG